MRVAMAESTPVKHPVHWSVALRRVASQRIVLSLGRALLVGFGVMVIVFLLIRLIPGDPVVILLGDLATDELVARYRELLGLNGSLGQQFLSYVGKVLRGKIRELYGGG